MIDFGTSTAIVGVDPGSRSTGVCLMRGDGLPRKSWSIRAKDGAPADRMRFIHGGVSRVFDLIARALPDRPVDVVIEEGVFKARPKVCSMLGEVRGIVMAETWRRGWTVRKVYPVSWKSGMSKAERKMKKDGDYIRYWNSRLSWDAKSADEIDAVLIGAHAARA